MRKEYKDHVRRYDCEDVSKLMYSVYNSAKETDGFLLNPVLMDVSHLLSSVTAQRRPHNCLQCGSYVYQGKSAALQRGSSSKRKGNAEKFNIEKANIQFIAYCCVLVCISSYGFLPSVN